MRKLLIMASLLCVGTDLANAETIEKLRGLMSVRLIVPELDEDAKSCGLSQELVRDAVMFPASSSKLEFLDATGDGAVFEVVITTIENKTKKFLTDWNLANKPLGTVDYPLQKR
jgi:hypothetical protein